MKYSKNKTKKGAQDIDLLLQNPTRKYNLGSSTNESKNVGIINEEPYKMKAGYEPSANLEKTLENIVVSQKNKKKKKKPTTFYG